MYATDRSFDLGEPIGVAFSLSELSSLASSQFDAEQLSSGNENAHVQNNGVLRKAPP